MERLTDAELEALAGHYEGRLHDRNACRRCLERGGRRTIALGCLCPECQQALPMVEVHFLTPGALLPMHCLSCGELTPPGKIGRVRVVLFDARTNQQPQETNHADRDRPDHDD